MKQPQYCSSHLPWGPGAAAVLIFVLFTLWPWGPGAAAVLILYCLHYLWEA